jgi:hypothetical protein
MAFGGLPRHAAWKNPCPCAARCKLFHTHPHKAPTHHATTLPPTLTQIPFLEMTDEFITVTLSRTNIVAIKYYDGEVSDGDKVTYQVVVSLALTRENRFLIRKQSQDYQKNKATEQYIAVMNSHEHRVGSVSSKKALAILPHLVNHPAPKCLSTC